MNQIMFIDIQKPILAVTLGPLGYNGVVAVYTKSVEDRPAQVADKPNWGVAHIQHSGYYSEQEFYSSKYGNTNTENQKLDCRTTRYWNPNLEIENKLIVPVELYPSYEQAEYIIKIEGITKQGKQHMVAAN